MTIRRLSLVVTVILLLPNPASAHDHVADFFTAFCFVRDSNLFGVQQALAITFPPRSDGDPGPPHKPISLVIDTSAHMGKHEGDPRTRVSIMGGVRYTITQILDPNRHLLTAHVLFGGVRDGGAITTADPAAAFGGGYEYLQDGTVTGLGFRVQVDYVVSGGENYPRFSGGLVYRK